MQISRIAESLDHFGEKFMRRLFTEHEIGYAMSSEALQAERFAKRFAASTEPEPCWRLRDGDGGGAGGRTGYE